MAGTRSVALAVVLGMAAICVTSWLIQLPVDDGGFVDAETVVEVDPGGAADRAGLRVGDRIVVDPGSDRRLLAETGWGDERNGDRFWLVWTSRMAAAMRSGVVPFVVIRDGQPRVVLLAAEGATFAASVRALRHLLLFVPTSVTFFGLALLLARRRRQQHRACAGLAIGFACVGAYFFLRAGPDAPRWAIVLYALRPALSVAGFTLIARAVWLLGCPERSGARFAVSGSGFVAATVIGLDILGWIPPVSPNNVLQFVAHGGLFVAIIAGLTIQWRRTEEAAARRDARLTCVIVGIGLLAPLLGVAAPSVFAEYWEPELFGIAWQLFLLVPIALTAAVARAGQVELDGRLPAVVLYAVVLGVALLLYGGFSLMAERLLAGAIATDSARWVSIAVVIVVAEPLRVQFRRGIDRLFARDRLALIAACSRLCAELAHVEETPGIELAVRNGLSVARARLCVLAELPFDLALAHLLVARGALRMRDLDEPNQRALADLGFDTLVHVPVGNRVWVLAIALPLAPVWDRAEREAIASVGHVIGSTIQQRTARRALEVRVAQSETQRREIAMELHDGLGATLTAARLMTQMARRSDRPHGEVLEGLEDTLQTGLHDLRVAVWSLDERPMTWGDLVSRLRRQLADVSAAVGLQLEIHSELPEHDSSAPATALAVFRIVQEAFANTLKHAHAHRAHCLLQLRDHGIALQFEDDGVGLPSPVPGGGRGLTNMNRRLEALGGKLQVATAESGGTRIDAWLPMGSHDHAVALDARASDPRQH